VLAIHLERGTVSVVDTPQPERPERYARVRLIYGGICNTDLELQRGYYGFAGTPGHEFVGEVVESDRPELVGKRVAGEINLSCGHCDFCLRGQGSHCANRTVLGIVKHPGAFSEEFTLPDRNLHVIPDAISNEQAVFIEPLAAACRILEQVDIPAGATVGLLGYGKLGRLIAQALRANGIGVDVGGAAGQYEYVVDATGSAAGLAQAVKMTRPLGTLILKSTVHGLVPVDTAGIVVNELKIVGSRCGPFKPAIRLLESGAVRVDNLISEIVPLSKAADAFEIAARRGVLKVLLRA
jgi:threonine dehydrogenase-like Zn-dependent dehydrogenase